MLISKIIYYILKYIQNLNKVLVNLEQVGVTIARVKFQFY